MGRSDHKLTNRKWYESKVTISTKNGKRVHLIIRYISCEYCSFVAFKIKFREKRKVYCDIKHKSQMVTCTIVGQCIGTRDHISD